MNKKDILGDLIKLSQEMGLYEDDEDNCEVCKLNHGWLTRIEREDSKVLCDECYFHIFKRNRK